MKKILVLGGTGQVGSKVVKHLQESGYEVSAASRHAEQMYKGTKVTPVTLDVTKSLKEIEPLIKGYDAIVDCLGNEKDVLDGYVYGQIKVIEAAKKNGVKRFVKLSGAGNDPESPLADEYRKDGIGYDSIAFFLVDNYLMNSGLDWTIVEATYFSTKPGTGKIKASSVATKVWPGTICVDDLAETISDSLNEKNTIKKHFAISNGDTPIEQAVKTVK